MHFFRTRSPGHGTVIFFAALLCDVVAAFFPFPPLTVPRASTWWLRVQPPRQQQQPQLQQATRTGRVGEHRLGRKPTTVKKPGRRARLMLLCAAVRRGEWFTIDFMLEEQSLSPAEWRVVVQAASQIGDYEGSMKLLEKMEDAGHKSDPAATGCVINACCKCDQPAEAQQLLDNLVATGWTGKIRDQLPKRTYTEMIRAWIKKGDWQAAHDLISKMPVEVRSLEACNAVLSAYSRAARWSEALKLVTLMEKSGPYPNLASYGSVASACKRAGTEPARELLQVLEIGGSVEPADSGFSASHAASYMASIIALAAAGKRKDAIEMYDSIPADIEKDDGLINAVVAAAVDRDDWKTAVRIIDDALESNVVPRISSFNLAFNALAAGRRPVEALKLLRRMRASGRRPNPLSYNAVLRALQSAGRWQQAARLLRDMRREELKPSLISYNLALGACAQAAKNNATSAKIIGGIKQDGEDVVANTVDDDMRACATPSEQAMELLLDISRRGLEPDSVSFASAIAAFAAVGDYTKVIGLLGKMDYDTKLDPDAFSWSAAIAACERGGDWQKALGLFNSLRIEGSRLDITTWNAALSAAGASGDVDLAESLLTDMRSQDHKPTQRAYSGVLKACERSADWDAALRILTQMRSEGLQPDHISYTLALGAAGRAGAWQRAFAMWQTMIIEGVPFDETTLQTLLIALLRGGQWQMVLFTFDQVIQSNDLSDPSDTDDFSFVRSTKLFALAFQACAEGAQRDKALELMEKMEEMNVLPTASCYHGLAASCAAAEDWDGALAVINGMLPMQPQGKTWRLVHDALLKAGKEEEANQLAKSASTYGVELIAVDAKSEAG